MAPDVTCYSHSLCRLKCVYFPHTHCDQNKTALFTIASAHDPAVEIHLYFHSLCGLYHCTVTITLLRGVCVCLGGLDLLYSLGFTMFQNRSRLTLNVFCFTFILQFLSIDPNVRVWVVSMAIRRPLKTWMLFTLNPNKVQWRRWCEAGNLASSLCSDWIG